MLLLGKIAYTILNTDIKNFISKTIHDLIIKKILKTQINYMSSSSSSSLLLSPGRIVRIIGFKITSLCFSFS